MSDLITNISRAVSDFQDIKQAIIDKGGDVPQGTPTSQYAQKINDIVVSEIGTGEHYAFAINQNVSVPGSMITYPTGYDNSDFTPAYMNYTTGEFDYGSWGNAFFLKKLKVVMLNFDGTEAYEIDPNDYTKKKDGTDVGTEGNVMVAVPKIYYKVSDNKNGTAIIHVSDTKPDDDYHCYAHIGINGGEKDYCYMAAYDGCYADNKLRSLTGQAPMGSQTAEEEVSRALANNPNPDNKNWYTGVAADRLLLQILLMMISKTTNSQTAFGYGFAKENSAAISSGTMDTKGLFWGETTGKHGVKVFGIENFWGNVWKRIGGWINDHGAQKLKMTYGTQDGSATAGYNFDGAGYVQINTCPVDGYIKGMSFVPFGLIPSATGGNMTSYFTDQFWNVKSQNNYGMVGGTYYTEEPAGMFYVSLNRPTSDMAINFGASLSYKL